jgi:predicted phage tail protein
MRKFTLLVMLMLFSAVTIAAQPQKKSKPLKATATSHSVILTWVQGVVPTGATCPSGSGSTAVTGNNVYRATTPGGEGSTAYATLTSPVATYTDSSVTAGTTYYYEVTAVNCSGESSKSTEASALIPNPLAPGAPSGLTVNVQ